MKIHFYFLLACLLILTSCNKDEGLGGSSSLEGYVYSVVHSDDNFSFAADTFPALDKDVFLEFGDDLSIGQRIRSGRDGYYRFDYLRKGNYTVYALSSFADDHKEAVTKRITVGGGLNQADTIYIHSGKAYGTAMISGEVKAKYYHNGTFRDEGPATGVRAYIKHANEEAYFDDVRVVDGVFIFQKLLPGNYIVAISNEDQNTEKVTLVVSGVISITQTGIIYRIPEIIVSVAV
ncbi:MAG: hypothetical protein LBN18_09085 [Dysgonamonadaceae bacterium]|jgi:hypothetical protein|nr:hypothetical protein [Dysgonamonadaceae bacterium]